MKERHELTYRRGSTPPFLAKKWARMPEAVAYSSLSRSELYRLIGQGIVESFLYKLRPDAKSGCRLVNLESVAAYLDRVAAEAKAEGK